MRVLAILAIIVIGLAYYVSVQVTPDSKATPGKTTCAGGTRFVIADTLNVRDAPETGKAVSVNRCDGEWGRISENEWVHLSYLSTDKIVKPARQITAAQTRRFRELRDDGIRLVGWIAGNSQLHPVWPEVESFVGRNGEYTRYFIRLAPPGVSERDGEAEALHNVLLYNDWVKKGRDKPFNEYDNIQKFKRIQQLAAEVLDAAK